MLVIIRRDGDKDDHGIREVFNLLVQALHLRPQSIVLMQKRMKEDFIPLGRVIRISLQRRIWYMTSVS